MTIDLSVNHYICGDSVSFPDFAAAAASAGLRAVGITRAAIAEMGIAGLESCLNDFGLAVSSLNSAGFFVQGDINDIRYRNEELVEYAARLNADVLCVITGGLGTPPVATGDAHALVRSGMDELARCAAEAGVVLGLEPIYPGDIITKGCINSCAHALDIVAPHDNAKLIVDLYHSWWEPDLPGLISHHQNKIALLQICDLRIADGLIVGRAPLSDGALDLKPLLSALLQENYRGTVELELFARDLGGRDPLDIIRDFPAEFEDLSS